MKKLLFLSFLIFLLLGLIAAANYEAEKHKENRPAKAARVVDERIVWVVAQNYAETRFRNPKFPWSPKRTRGYKFIDFKDDSYYIRAYADVPNIYGTLQRAWFSVVLTHANKDPENLFSGWIASHFHRINMKK